MTDKKIQLDLVADAKDAIDPIEDVADAADDLTKKPFEAEITADTDKADDRTKRIAEGLERLEKQPWIAEIRADIDKAMSDAKRLEDQLSDIDVDVDTSAADRRVKDLGTGGSNVAGTLRDLGGPLGEATNQVGDFAEAFETAGAMAASQFGLSGTATTAMTMGLGAVGVVIGGLTILWQNVQKENEKAKQRVDDYKDAIDKANGSLREGAKIKLAESLSDEDVQRLADYGLTLDDVVDAMNGKTVPALEAMRDKAAKASEAVKSTTMTPAERQPLLEFVADVDKINGMLGKEESALRRAADANRARQKVLQDSKTATDTYNQQLSATNDRLGIMNTKIKEIPPTKRSDITVTDNGTADSTGREIDAVADKRRTAHIEVEPTGESMRRLNDAINNAMRSGALSGSVTNVTVNSPRGIGWDAAARQATRRYARRNGGRG